MPDTTDALTLSKLQLLPELRLDGIHLFLGYCSGVLESLPRLNIVYPCLHISYFDYSV